MRGARWMLLACLLEAPAPAAEPYVSRAQLLALPPGEAAEVLFGQFATNVVEMQVDQLEGGAAWLSFATAVDTAGESGLCRARLLTVALAPSAAAASPPVVESWEVEDVYKVIGPAQPTRALTDADRAAQARLCAASRRVLEARPTAHAARGYFTYESPGHPWMAVAALQSAIDAARNGSYGDVRCATSYEECGDPRARLGSLDLGNLMRLEFAREGGSSLRFHLIATFADGVEALPLEIAISVDVSALPDGPTFFSFQAMEIGAGYY